MTDERYEVQNEEAKRAMRTIATLVEEQVPDGMGFMVFVFDFGPGGALFYMSNAQREDVIKTMKEFIEREEKLGKARA